MTSLQILPLGGCGEVGLNSTLFVHGSDAVLVDCGILLGLPDAPGCDSAIPDFGPMARDGRTLRAVVLTHGHEDHIGAVGRLLDEHPVEVYGPPLAIELLEHRLESAEHRARLRRVAIGDTIELGPFSIEFIRVTHSLPDSAALCITTPAGRVLHSGDYKLDPTPVDGHVTNVERLRSLGDEGIDLLLADSTNSEQPGHTRSEADVGLELERQVAKCEGRVVVACFASHLHRVQGIVRAATASGRKIALFGRGLQTTWGIGAKTGYLDLVGASLVDASKVASMQRRDVLIIATGTQGEGRSALTRLSQDDSFVTLEPGDTVINSSMTIPGNLLPVRRVANAFARRGVKVIDDHGAAVHCSGHAHADEQVELLGLVRPKAFVPIHGERTMLEAHARRAAQCGVRDVQVIENGQWIRLQSDGVHLGEHETLERRFIDGASRTVISWDEVGERRRVGFSGLVVCTVVIDGETGRTKAEPSVTLVGIPGEAALAPKVAREVSNALAVAKRRAPSERERVVKSAINRAIRRSLDARPLIQVRLIAL